VLPLQRIFVDADQLVLKLRGEDLMKMAEQKEKELGALDALDDFVLRRRGLNRRPPRGWPHNQIAPHAGVVDPNHVTTSD
jgi:hypothetical protein